MKRYWPNNSTYFLTGSTFIHFPYFKTFEQKMLVLNQIIKVKKVFGIPEIIFSIAINHYHLKFYLKNGLDLARIKQMMHGGISYEYHKIYKPKYKEMWQSFRALIVLSEEVDSKVMGYIIGNLLKHKEVTTFLELEKNPFSSYGKIAAKYGEQRARELVYGVIDTTEDAEGKVDIGDLKSLTLG
ncbi:MAG: hypothetical protein ABIH38_05675 [Patescibacteria group bacterium]